VKASGASRRIGEFRSRSPLAFSVAYGFCMAGVFIALPLALGWKTNWPIATLGILLMSALVWFTATSSFKSWHNKHFR
jgi:hypothetical protein